MTSLAILACVILKKISSSMLAYCSFLIDASSMSFFLNSLPILAWTCSMTLCISGEYVGRGTLSNLSLSSSGTAFSCILWLSNEYLASCLPCHSLLFRTMSHLESVAAWIPSIWPINSSDVVPLAGLSLPCMPGRKRSAFTLAKSQDHTRSHAYFSLHHSCQQTILLQTWTQQL